MIAADHGRIAIMPRPGVANTIRVAGHVLVDASPTMPVACGSAVTPRGRNLANAFYGGYSGYPATGIYIGAPRSFEIAFASRLRTASGRGRPARWFSPACVRYRRARGDSWRFPPR
jgi:hypothetical protein